MLQYFVEDSDSAIIVTTTDFAEVGKELAEKTGRPLLIMDNTFQKLAMKQPDILTPLHFCDQVVDHPLGGAEQELVTGQPDDFYAESDAMMVYTSGTTGKPKGQQLKSIFSKRNLIHRIT